MVGERLVVPMVWAHTLGRIIAFCMFWAGVLALFVVPAVGLGIILGAFAVNFCAVTVTARVLGLNRESVPGAGSRLGTGAQPLTPQDHEPSPVVDPVASDSSNSAEPYPDNDEREFLSEEGLDADDPESIFRVALARSTGLSGLSKDETRADQLYRAAADAGNGSACWFVAYQYSIGRCVPMDRPKAVDWFATGASRGDADCQSALADRYLFGDGVTKDIAKAIEWYERAAGQGCEVSMCALGELYEEGEDIAPDTEKALHWYRLAAKEGDEEAKVKVAQLES